MKIGYSLQLGDLNMKIKRHLYIKKRSKSENKTTVCAVQYSPICSDIKKIIDKHRYVLKSDPLLSDIFEKTPRFVYKRSSNIRDLLVRADVSTTLSLFIYPFG